MSKRGAQQGSDHSTGHQRTLEPPPSEMQQIFAAIHGNQAAMTRFAQMNAGTISPAEFFSPQSVAQMVGASGAG